MTTTPTSRADANYPSTAAMMSAVEMEIMSALGSVQTVSIGKLIQKAIDAETATLKERVAELEGALRDCVDILEGAQSGFIQGSDTDMAWDKGRDMRVEAARSALSKDNEHG